MRNNKKANKMKKFRILFGESWDSIGKEEWRGGRKKGEERDAKGRPRTFRIESKTSERVAK